MIIITIIFLLFFFFRIYQQLAHVCVGVGVGGVLTVSDEGEEEDDISYKREIDTYRSYC